MKTKYILSSLLVMGTTLTACTDLNEQLFDKVSMNDYGKNETETSTI